MKKYFYLAAAVSLTFSGSTKSQAKEILVENKDVRTLTHAYTEVDSVHVQVKDSSSEPYKDQSVEVTIQGWGSCFKNDVFALESPIPNVFILKSAIPRQNRIQPGCERKTVFNIAPARVPFDQITEKEYILKLQLMSSPDFQEGIQISVMARTEVIEKPEVSGYFLRLSNAKVLK